MNPFATKFTRPGAIPFLSTEASLLPRILRRLQLDDYMGQIIGPHGSGKTTLTYEIQRQLKTEFELFRHLTVRKPSRPFGKLEMVEVTSAGVQHVDRQTWNYFLHHVPVRPALRTMYFFDGWGQVESFNRSQFIENCRVNGIGLVATVHRKRSVLPVLAEIQSDRQVFNQIVRYLQRNSVLELQGSDIEAAFTRASGNFREAFMILFDVYEKRYRRMLSDSH